MDYTSIITGILAGATYGASTFAKKEGQEFDLLKFGTTVIIGAGSGAAMGLFNMDIEIAYTYAIQIGTVTIVENTLKGLYRKVWKKLTEAWIKIKLKRS